MARKRMNPEKRTYAFSIVLRKEQIDWLNSNNKFNLNKFVRDNLDEYILIQRGIKQLK